MGENGGRLAPVPQQALQVGVCVSGWPRARGTGWNDDGVVQTEGGKPPTLTSLGSLSTQLPH